MAVGNGSARRFPVTHVTQPVLQRGEGAKTPYTTAPWREPIQALACGRPLGVVYGGAVNERLGRAVTPPIVEAHGNTHIGMELAGRNHSHRRRFEWVRAEGASSPGIEFDFDAP